MFNFAWPCVFLFLPLPFLIYRFCKPAHTIEPALQVPFFNQIESLTTTHATSNRSVKLALLIIIWLLCVFASARPQWIGDAAQIPVTGRDLILAVDVSGSMKAKDPNPQIEIS